MSAASHEASDATGATGAATVRLHVAAVVAAVALAAAVRLPFLARADFPLFDGGMFFAMSSDLQVSGFALPSHTSFNGGAIPFAYPPLGFYLAAAVAAAADLPLLAVFRWLPLLLNLATVMAVASLARRLLPTPRAAVIAALAFSLFPFSYRWLIMGGGVARSLGMLCFVAATAGLLRCLDGARAHVWVGTALAAAGAVLSHPELGVATIVTAPLAAWFTAGGGRTRIRRVGGAAAVLAAAALLASPWWITVLLRHGVRPFLAAAASTTGSLTDLLRWLAVFPATAEPGLGVLAVLGVLGILGLAATGRPLALLWLLALVVTVPRNSATPITIPLALGVAASLDALATAFAGRREQGASAKGFGSAAVVLLAGWALGYAFLENRMLLERADDVLPVLDTGERELAAWIEAHTPPEARFLIVTSAAEGEPDPFSEWFPALAGRVSILTPQGLEWTGGYNDRAALAARFQACVPEGAACIDSLGRALPSFTHVLVCTQARGSHGVLRMLGELVRSPAFERVHATPAGVVLARRPGG